MVQARTFRGPCALIGPAKLRIVKTSICGRGQHVSGLGSRDDAPSQLPNECTRRPSRRVFRPLVAAEAGGRRKGGDRTISAERQRMIGSIAAKLVAVLAAAGTIFYGVAYVSNRGESDGIRSRLERAVAPGTPRRSSSLELLQRRAAEKDACASGNMAGDCSHLA